MTRTNQLRLIRSDSVQMSGYAESADPLQRCFGEWLYWSGKSAARCKLGPTRRAAIRAALLLYDEPLLRLCWIGAAADEWLAEHPHLGPEWVLQSESRIEAYIAAGERLQARAARDVQAPAGPDQPTVAETDEQRAAHAASRARLLAMVRRSSGREVADE